MSLESEALHFVEVICRVGLTDEQKAALAASPPPSAARPEQGEAVNDKKGADESGVESTGGAAMKPAYQVLGDRIYTCSFCHKGTSDLRMLVVDGDVGICNRCIGICFEVMMEHANDLENRATAGRIAGTARITLPRTETRANLWTPARSQRMEW